MHTRLILLTPGSSRTLTCVTTAFGEFARYLRLVAVLWVFGLMLAAPSGWALAGEYTKLEAEFATAINAQGEIIGDGCLATPQCSAAVGGNGPFLLSNGTYSTISFPPSVLAVIPLGINESREIVGNYLDVNFVQHGFLLRNGAFTNIDPPGASGTTVNGINARGEMVGQYFDNRGVSHDFLLRNRVFTYFAVPIRGSTADSPNGINAQGDIVGSYTDSSGNSHGFQLSKGGAVSTFDFPGASSTSALGINSRGDIVGSYTVPANNNPYTLFLLMAFY